MTLPELILVMAMLMGVLGGTLDTLDNFVRTNRTNERQNENQDRARQSICLLYTSPSPRDRS